MKAPSSGIVTYKIFGRDNAPTIYYLTGFKSTIKQYRPHIAVLTRAGFRIVIFQYHKNILMSGEPRTLIESLRYIERVVAEDKKGRPVAGVYGVSLGSWLGFNIMRRCKITYAMFNGGGMPCAETIWHNPHLAAVKREYKNNGYDFGDLEQAWADDELRVKAVLDGKRVIMLNSKADEIMDINGVRQTIKVLRDEGAEVRWIVVRGLRHAPSIVWHVLRFRLAVVFFRSALAK
jgi:predicted esterase YcpF (UPF0227 family)